MRSLPTYLALLLMLHASVALALTPAGTIVRGQAAAIVDGETYLSNEVGTLVRAVCGVSISPNGTSAAPAHHITGLPGAPAYLPYVLHNTGNATHAYSLGLTHEPRSDWAPAGHVFYLDANRNARVDPNEDPITMMSLAAGRKAHLVLAATAPTGATGKAFVTATAACPTTRATASSTSAITLAPDVVLQLDKHATPNEAIPGGRVAFEASVANTGTTSTTGPLVITDRLDTPEMAGIAFDAGSAHHGRGAIEYFDGSTWSTTEPARVKGVRVLVDRLDPGEAARLTFTVTVTPDAKPGERSNALTVTHEGSTQRKASVFEVKPARRHAFGPDGNSTAFPGGDGTEDDAQEVTTLAEGQPTCVVVTLLNAGSGSDRYDLLPLDVPSGVRTSFETLAGTPLPLPLALARGEETSFRFCLTATTAKASGFDVVLRATSLNDGVSNATRVRVAMVIPIASVTARLTATPHDTLAPGQEVTYQLEVTNTSDADLTRARLTLPLPTFPGENAPILEFKSASHDGRVAPQDTVVWTADVLPSRGRLARTVTFRVEEAELDGSIHRLEEAFTFRSHEITNPVESNTVAHTYPGYELLASLAVAPKDVRIAQEAEVVFTLTNPTRYAVTIDPRALLPTGLVPAGEGEARIGSTTHAVHATETGDELAWPAEGGASLVLGPTGTATDRLVLAYDVVANARATPVLQVEGWATGSLTVGGTTTPIDSNRASHELRLVEDAFARPEGLLTGRVYLDRDEDARFDPSRDAPLANARVLLSNGWQATTDADGLYAFRSLRHGPWLALLDPNSAPFPAPLGVRHLVNVQGTYVLDFPLTTPTGSMRIERSTTLTYGPVTLRKRLTRRADATLVTLTLTSSETLEDVTIRDPRPDGSAREFQLDTLHDEHTFTYRLPADAPLTDPDVRWKDVR